MGVNFKINKYFLVFSSKNSFREIRDLRSCANNTRDYVRDRVNRPSFVVHAVHEISVMSHRLSFRVPRFGGREGAR